jgi:hypothetical protein
MKRVSIIVAVLLGSCSFALAQGTGSSSGGAASGAASTGSSTSAGSSGANSGNAVRQGTTGSNLGATPSSQPPSPGAYNPTSPTGNTDTGVFKK